MCFMEQFGKNTFPCTAVFTSKAQNKSEIQSYLILFSPSGAVRGLQWNGKNNLWQSLWDFLCVCGGEILDFCSFFSNKTIPCLWRLCKRQNRMLIERILPRGGELWSNYILVTENDWIPVHCKIFQYIVHSDQSEETSQTNSFRFPALGTSSYWFSLPFTVCFDCPAVVIVTTTLLQPA